MTQREEYESAFKGYNLVRSKSDSSKYGDKVSQRMWEAYQEGFKAAKAQAVPQWIPVSERLPDEDYGYFLVTRKHWRIDDPRVCCSFYIKDRDRAKREYANGYSRKYQGKDSIHFECSRGGFIITHWMPFPAAPEQNK